MPREIALYQVDAFTDRPFAGNPAAVCPLDAWLPDDVMQAIAAENNLSETAFFVHEGDGAGDGGDFHLRWFTPTIEVELCGHATLASAFVVMTELAPSRALVTFHSKSGPLAVARDAALLTMDFPSWPPRAIAPGARIIEAIGAALGATPVAVVESRVPVAIFDDAATVRSLRPHMAAIAALDAHALAVTAPGTGADTDVDFVSRYFAPRAGIPEDPVTGSLLCTLAPYWTDRLERRELRSRQVSARSGELGCALRGDRVAISGRAVLVLRGTLLV